eukprot:6557988-Alexandrium_andersonii.AAC.1
MGCKNVARHLATLSHRLERLPPTPADPPLHPGGPPHPAGSSRAGPCLGAPAMQPLQGLN